MRASRESRTIGAAMSIFEETAKAVKISRIKGDRASAYDSYDVSAMDVFLSW